MQISGLYRTLIPSLYDINVLILNLYVSFNSENLKSKGVDHGKILAKLKMQGGFNHGKASRCLLF